jgi:succinate dehydrogenase/fumarate reductase cytochrome b subunit
MILQQALFRSPRAAAILDILEACSGLALALFLWMHMVFVATIFLGTGAFDGIAQALDTYSSSFCIFSWLPARYLSPTGSSASSGGTLVSWRTRTPGPGSFRR